MEAKCFHRENKHAYSARVLKNDDCHHLNNMSVVCKTSLGRQEKSLKNIFHLTLKIEEHLPLQKPSQTPFSMGLSSPSSTTQKEYTQKLSATKIATIIIEFGGFHHYDLIKVAEHIASEGAILKGA